MTVTFSDLYGSTLTACKARAGLLLASGDQVINGARQFFSLLLAATLMSREAFADFAVLNATAIFLVQFANYCFCLPMLVFSGGKFKTARYRYRTLLGRADAFVTALLGIPITCYLCFRFDRIDRLAALGFILLCVTGNLFDLCRRFAYVEARPGLALRANITCTLATLVGLLAAQWTMHGVSVHAAILVQVVAFVAGLASGRSKRQNNDTAAISYREIFEAHRPYAGWELAGGLFLWSATNGLIVIAGNLFSSEQIGAYRLLTSLCGLISFPLLVAENSYTTIASEQLTEKGRVGLARWLHSLNSQLLILLVPYVSVTAVICWAFVHFILQSRYPEAEHMLPVFVCYMAFTLLATTGNITLRAMTLTRYICASEFARAAACFLVAMLAMNLHSPFTLTTGLVFGAAAFLFVQSRAVHNQLGLWPSVSTATQA